MGEAKPLRIDGARGEGGGQILRTALMLGLLTGRGLRFVRIREGRPQPGLKAQHLAAIEAAGAVSGARIQGAELGSREVAFDPGPVRPGRYQFEIGTAGSASLVIQTVAIPLALAGGPSRVSVSGGTHAPWSPSGTYLEWHWGPWAGSVGLEIDVSVEAVGFYPKGGGRLSARIQGGSSLRPWVVPERGALREVRGEVVIARLSRSIADRIIREAGRRLRDAGLRADLSIREVSSPGPGVAFDLLGRFEHTTFATTALGKRGVPAERLGAAAVEDLRRFLAGKATADRHLADQVVGPLALAPEVSRFRTAEVTRHLRTNAGTVALFLGDRVEVGGEEGEEAEVTVR